MHSGLGVWHSRDVGNCMAVRKAIVKAVVTVHTDETIEQRWE